ncbi:hypothetical protein ACA910_007243 [Epithemia clementina (nom. ined.)]
MRTLGIQQLRMEEMEQSGKHQSIRGMQEQQYFSIKSQFNYLCLAIASTDNLSPVFLSQCIGNTSSQLFLYNNSSGHLESKFGSDAIPLCVEGDSNPGAITSSMTATVFVYSPCYDTWTFDDAGTFLNDGEQLCLTAALFGNEVSVQQCTGDPDQQWEYVEPESTNPTNNLTPSPTGVVTPTSAPATLFGEISESSGESSSKSPPSGALVLLGCRGIAYALVSFTILALAAEIA